MFFDVGTISSISALSLMPGMTLYLTLPISPLYKPRRIDAERQGMKMQPSMGLWIEKGSNEGNEFNTPCLILKFY